MSFDKLLKGATKSKADIPKGKYVDPIITATYSSDGAVADICRGLNTRLKEPNSVIVFKSLLVLHQMIRSGSTDNVLGYLSGSQDVLKLRNVVGNAWEGYKPPKNLGAYAAYLHARIRGYKDLKHDPVRQQAESNRQSNYEGASAKVRKLRSLTVDKGLLKEIRAVQAMISSATNCRFFEDDLEDQCTVLAFKMMVKDVLVLTQAVNEGVVNLLEHYFEMAKTDAQDALKIYKSFCRQTEETAEYLAMARSLNSVIDVPVPNLKNAPVSLVTALEEYLNAPEFEQNRLEYRQNMGAADVAPTSSSSGSGPAKETTSSSAPKKEEDKKSSASAPAPAAQQAVNRTMQDFLSSIEEEQKNPQANMMLPQITGVGMGGMGMGMGGMQGMNGMPMGMGMNAYGAPQQQPMINPFRQSTMFPQATGFQPQLQMPFQQQAGTAQPQQPQSTGYAQPQPGPFLQNSPQRQQPFMAAPFTPSPSSGSSPFISSPTGPVFSAQNPSSPGLQPQATGINPFRQSVMAPQSTGMAQFNQSFQPSSTSSSPGPKAVSFLPTPSAAAPALAGKGSTNPFHLPSDDVPRQQAGPSLFELAQQRTAGAQQGMQSQPTGYSGQGIQAQQTGFSLNGGGVSGGTPNSHSQQIPTPHPQSLAPPSASTNSYMSDLASAFSIPPPPQNHGSVSGLDHLFNNVSGLPVPRMAGEQDPSKAFDISSLNIGSTLGGANGSRSEQADMLQPQKTGFGGSTVKPFKPSSNFGSSMMTTLPSVSSPSSPGPTSPNGMAPQATGFNPFASMGQQQTGFGGGQQGPSNAFASAYGQQSPATNSQQHPPAPNNWAASFGN